jgi:hypothetical protein
MLDDIVFPVPKEHVLFPLRTLRMFRVAERLADLHGDVELPQLHLSVSTVNYGRLVSECIEY